MDEQQRCTESFTTRLPERRYKNKEKNIKLNTHLQLERARFGEAVIRGFLTDFTSTLCSLLWVDDWEPCEAQQQQKVLGFSFQSSLTG